MLCKGLDPTMNGAHTSFTELTGCRIPIQQAGMGTVATPELVVAVAEAGALGMLGMPMCSATEFGPVLEMIKTTTPGAFGVNFLVPFLDLDTVTVAAANARVVEFFFGEPDSQLVAHVHAQGALVSWQIGSTDEASAAADAGCDFVIAQGVEAGGHVRGEIPLLALLDAVLGSVDIPVLAAGGIATAHKVKEVISAGAAGARIGTRFLAAHETDVHPEYLESLISANGEATVLTKTFSVGWPDAPHRVLRSCVVAAKRTTDDPVGEIERPEGGSLPVPRFAALPPTGRTRGHIHAMALYAGQAVGEIRGREAAADIVRDLTSEL